MEGQPGYQCDVTANDCHLLVVDRANHRLYESYQSNYNTATGQFEVRAVDTRTRTQIVTATPPSYHLMDQQICLPPIVRISSLLMQTACIIVWDMCRDYPDGSATQGALRGEWCTRCAKTMQRLVSHGSSADAAGYPISPLLVTPDEVKNNNVDHAIRYAT